MAGQLGIWEIALAIMQVVLSQSSMMKMMTVNVKVCKTSNNIKQLFLLPVVALGQSQPLIHRVIIWESETPLTSGQLQGKRDTFWETAPLYEGRKEIWDALKAAAEAAEEEDYDLAQAILTGANISLPKGHLLYIVLRYCFINPLLDL